MQRVTGDELKKVMQFFDMAAVEAKKSTCIRAKCGSVIVKNDKVIGKGYNSPPQDKESQRMCSANLNDNKKPKYDTTCCVHAEWRAIIDMCKQYTKDTKNSKLYFMRIDENGLFTNAGLPFCTVCSRLAMDSGVENFLLWNDNGADLYTTAEYNIASYSFYK